MSTKECGLYRATKPIPAGDQFVEAPRLVYFHNHSNEGEAMVLLPEENVHNVWSFGKQGFLIESPGFIDSLEPLKAQGLYRVREHFHPNENEVVNKEALVQLGYNGAGEPILFFPLQSKDENALAFPISGMKVTSAIYELLEPLDTAGPYTPAHRHVH